jgi:PAP2 superfamily
MPMRTYVLIPGLCCALGTMAMQAHASDAVTEWNQIAVERTLNAMPAQSPVQQTRTMAIVQVSVHDAINAITGQYETYRSHGAVPANASPIAAAIAAAHHALRTLFPDHSGELDDRYSASLSTHGVSGIDPGLEFGVSVAAAILALRADDHAAHAQFDYTVPEAGAPGVWVRLGGAPALLPGWGNVTPWVMRSGGQFRPDAPPALTSERYAKDYNEVKDIGSVSSLVRTDEQTQIAMFWRASPTAIWNGVLTQVLAARNLSLSAKARVFALMYLAAADSSIACWEAKYFHNFWRPFPAIVSGDLDGNPGTTADAAWLSLLGTPPHPEYPSGHTTNSNAMVTVLRLVFGDDPGVLLHLTVFGVTRQWQTFEQGIDEVIDARVYSGIHYRNSDDVGARLGRQVAHFIMTHALRPPTGPWRK